MSSPAERTPEPTAPPTGSSVPLHGEFEGRAIYVGERIDVRTIELGRRIATRPLTLELNSGAVVVLFRWGAAVFFGATESEVDESLREVRARTDQAYERPETETALIRIDPAAPDGMDGDVISVKDSGVPRLQTLASVLGKSVALGQYEIDTAASFDRIEPFARSLEQHGRGGRDMGELLRHIGRVLLNEHKLLGRVEVAEKPDILWDHPEVEPLYARLDGAYDLGERAEMLDRKLEQISRTVHTVLDLLQHRRSLRVEWYIVILIVVEIALLLFDMWRRG